jgi:hypothetical protein
VQKSAEKMSDMYDGLGHPCYKACLIVSISFPEYETPGRQRLTRLG